MRPVTPVESMQERPLKPPGGLATSNGRRPTRGRKPYGSGLLCAMLPILAVAARKGIEPAPSLAHEALEVAQWASQSSAAAALQQMSTRFALGGGALASLVRESQDLAVAWRDLDEALLDALSNPEGRHERARIDALRKRIAETETRLNALPHASIRNFPTMLRSHILSRLRPKRCRGCLAPTKHLYSSWWGTTRATFLRLRARVSNGGRFRSARRTWRRRSPPSAAA